MFKNIRKRYAVWKDWCRYNGNTKIYQILVFLGLAKSRSLEIKIAFAAMRDSIETIFTAD